MGHLPRGITTSAKAVAAVCLTLVLDAPARTAEKPRPPNIVFIMADDMGRDWVGCYGAVQKTPNIDRLAREGLRFTHVWACPICTPTRAQLLTGRYPFRTGWTDHHDVPRWGGAGLDPAREVTFARVLKQAGYATAIGGKWQINDLRKDADTLKKHGFDEHCTWVGFETGNPPSAERYWGAYLQTNGKRQTHTGKFGPDLVNEFVVDFIKRHKDRPFLVYYPMVLPHGPFVKTPLNKDDPPQGRRALYAGMVGYVDQLVARVVKAVDDLKLSERTIIIFTTDNGSPLAGGSIDGVRYPAGKGKIADVGVHVPFIVRAPGFVKAGGVTDELVDFSDMLPTLADLAGAPLPKARRGGVTPPLHGRSFAPVLRGKEGGRDWIYSQRGDKRTVRDKRYKLDSTGGFWDIAADPLQKKDLRDSDEPKVKEARERLGKVLRSLPADAGPPFKGYRPAGKR